MDVQTFFEDYSLALGVLILTALLIGLASFDAIKATLRSVRSYAHSHWMTSGIVALAMRRLGHVDNIINRVRSNQLDIEAGDQVGLLNQVELEILAGRCRW